MNLEKLRELIDMQTSLVDNYERLFKVQSSDMASRYTFTRTQDAIENVAGKIQEELMSATIIPTPSVEALTP